MSSSNHSSVTVSVIIPAYNSERGVAKAVESLQKQTIDENALEIILVNDGSTDSTSAICHELAGKASNIVVIDKERIVERGTHQELLALGGWYEQMWEKQQLEAKIEGGEEDGR